MENQKPRFEARDLSSDYYAINNEGEFKYTGPERRRVDRRSGKDRRAEVRFDLSAQDRRQSRGRRKNDQNHQLWWQRN